MITNELCQEILATLQAWSDIFKDADTTGISTVQHHSIVTIRYWLALLAQAVGEYAKYRQRHETTYQVVQVTKGEPGT